MGSQRVMHKKFISVLFITLVLLILGCGGGSSNEAEIEEAKEIEESIVEEIQLADSVAAEEEQAIYCCSNHSPSHCGRSDELEDLTKNNGCSGFE
jgi:hypothetical protein